LIQADRVLIRMALSNLLSNAIKFTPDGGTVTMRVEREDHKLHISVQDTGVGVAEENLSLLFNPFFTTIDVSRGSTSKTQFMGMGMGMGLTIVSKVIGAHKGQVWAESPGYDEEKFPGATFHILLPAPLLSDKETATTPKKEVAA
jgi:signal transduction histidine kinase